MYEVIFRFARECAPRRLVFEDLWVARQVWQKLSDWGAIMETEKPSDPQVLDHH